MADPANDTFFIYVKQFVKELLNPLGLFELQTLEYQVRASRYISEPSPLSQEHRLTNLNSYYVEDEDEEDDEDLCSSHGCDERTEELETVDEQDNYEIDDSTYDHFIQNWFYR